MTRPGGPDSDLPPEQYFPVALIGLHGLPAVTTMVLVLLTALGLGDQRTTRTQHQVIGS